MSQLLTAVCSPNNIRKMDLLNCSLPVEQTDTIATILQKNELPFQIPSPETKWGWNYNCWGYVAFNFGWEDDARWLPGETMEEHLTTHTKPINKSNATMGDIAVFRRWGSLAHTALVTYELDIICHKPGAGELCVDSMERAKSMYGDEVTYVRPIR